MMTEAIIARGKSFAILGNAVSDAIHDALKRGMQIDEAACCVVAVASDYARAEYGDKYLLELAEVVKRRREMPLPEDVSSETP